MPLTNHDREHGHPWLIVGTRADGSRLVIEGAQSQAAAERRAAVFREHLEGYREIAVERAGAPSMGARGSNQFSAGYEAGDNVSDPNPPLHRERSLLWTSTD